MGGAGGPGPLSWAGARCLLPPVPLGRFLRILLLYVLAVTQCASGPGCFWGPGQAGGQVDVLDGPGARRPRQGIPISGQPGPVCPRARSPREPRGHLVPVSGSASNPPETNTHFSSARPSPLAVPSAPGDAGLGGRGAGTGCGDGVWGRPLNPFVELKASVRQGPGGVSELRRESPGDMLPEAPGRWTRQVLEKQLRRHPRRLGGWKNPVNFQEQSAGPQARVGMCGMRETAE